MTRALVPPSICEKLRTRPGATPRGDLHRRRPGVPRSPRTPGRARLPRTRHRRRLRLDRGGADRPPARARHHRRRLEGDARRRRPAGRPSIPAIQLKIRDDEIVVTGAARQQGLSRPRRRSHDQARARRRRSGTAPAMPAVSTSRTAMAARPSRRPRRRAVSLRGRGSGALLADRSSARRWSRSMVRPFSPLKATHAPAMSGKERQTGSARSASSRPNPSRSIDGTDRKSTTSLSEKRLQCHELVLTTASHVSSSAGLASTTDISICRSGTLQ